MFCTTFLRICDIMEKVTFDYSMKNIPLPSKNTYKAKLHVKVENVIKRMRWKSYFFHNPSASNQQTSNWFEIQKKSIPCLRLKTLRKRPTRDVGEYKI